MTARNIGQAYFYQGQKVTIEKKKGNKLHVKPADGFWRVNTTHNAQPIEGFTHGIEVALSEIALSEVEAR
ncbi:MAG: hypothetical protein AAFQ40_01445 [Cyanobacteria bacterium J06623_5]